MSRLFASLMWVLVFTLSLLLAPQEAKATTAIITCLSNPCSGVEGSTLSFSASASTGTGSLSYSWDLNGDGNYNDPASPSSLAPTWTYNTPKDYTVRLRVTDSLNQTNETSLVVPISNASPTARVYVIDAANVKQYASATIFSGTMVAFYGAESSDVGKNSGNGISRYEWMWNYTGVFVADVAGYSYSAADHAYANAGDYVLALRVRDDDSDSSCDTLPASCHMVLLNLHVIGEGPIARITSPSGTVLRGTAATFTDASLPVGGAAIVKWEWDFDYAVGNFTADLTETSATGPNRNPSWIFRKAHTYRVALRVTDGNGHSDTADVDVYPADVAPVTQMVVRDAFGQILSEPITVNEGQPITFDTSSTSYPPDPTLPLVVWWDPSYDLHTAYGFQADPAIQGFTYTRSFSQDTIRRNPPNQPYKVAARALNDNAFYVDPPASATITVLDVLPVAAITSGPIELKEGETGSFRVADNSGNTDPIVNVEWMWNYSGDCNAFVADVSGTALLEATHVWNSIALVTIGARITDRDGFKSCVAWDLTVIDKPAKAIISLGSSSTAYADGEMVDVDEGSELIFSARNSLLATALDRFADIKWDGHYNGTTFNDESAVGAKQCVSSTSKCNNVPWLSCSDAVDCPSGPGDFRVLIGDGPHPGAGDEPRCLALCVLDDDRQTACVPGSDSFTKICFNVRNVAPRFEPAGPLKYIKHEHDLSFTFLPTIVEPSTPDLSALAFSCLSKPAGMSCNTNTGFLDWTFTSDNIECAIGDENHQYQVVLKVTDKDGAGSTLTINLEVLNDNDPPYFQSFTPESSVNAGKTLGPLFVGRGLDPDAFCLGEGEQAVWYSIGSTIYAGMSIAPETGAFTWNVPANFGERDVTVKICIRDTAAAPLTVCQNHIVHVLNPEDNAECSPGPAINALPGKICLDGSVVSNPGNLTLTYRWEQKGSDPETIALVPDTTSEHPRACFVASAVGTYQISLACDTSKPGAESLTTVTIGNLNPGVVLSGDRTYGPGILVNLDATRSGDPNDLDSIKTYAWTDPREVLAKRDIAKPSFSATVPGLYGFSLQVTDNNLGQSEPREMMIEIADLDNRIAMPYATFTVTPCDGAGCSSSKPAVKDTQIRLDASLTRSRSDNLGDLQYAWEYLDGPGLPSEAGSYEDRPDLYQFKPTLAGLYRFQLKVLDGTYQSRSIVRSVAVGESLGRQAPLAAAGSDQRVQLRHDAGSLQNYVFVNLDGSGSSGATGDVLTHTWKQVAGLPVTLLASAPQTAVKPAFYAFKPGLYAFELSVTSRPTGADESRRLASLPDTVVISVAAEDAAAPLPVITTAGYVASTSLLTVNPNTQVVLDASTSTGKAPLRYSWSQVGGPAMPIDNWEADSGLLVFTPDLVGQTYVFRLIIWDANGSPSLPLDINVAVNAETNTPPVCLISEATRAQDAVVGDTVTLDASATNDPDAGQILSYHWAQIGGPTASLQNASSAVAKFVPQTEGDYEFRFVANDGLQDCLNPPSATVHVGPDVKPVANAGPDQKGVCVGTEVRLDGSASYSPVEHTLTSYAWTVESGDAFGLENLSDPTNPTPIVTAITSTGTMVLSLVVSDGFLSSDPDTVTIEIVACTCFDKDGDGYYATATNGACGEEGKPWDCNDGEKEKNKGKAGSCDCADVDQDDYGTGAECLGPDQCDDDASAHTATECKKRCVDLDNDNYGDGPDCLGEDCDDNNALVHDTCKTGGGSSGCAQSPDRRVDLGSLLLASLLGAALLRRRRLRGAR